MDLEIVNKKENPLLKRTEVTFRLAHPKEKTPQRLAVRDKIAAATGGKREAVIIERMRTHFGVATTFGYAKVYDSPETAKKTEPQHLLKRHGLVEVKAEAKPGEAKAEAKPPAPKAETKPAPAKPAAEKAEAKPAVAKPAGEKK